MAGPAIAAGARLAASAVQKVDFAGMGKRAIAFASNNAPGALAQAQAVIAKATGGTKTLSQLAESKSPTSQGMIVKALLEGGMSAAAFSETVVMTDAERNQYSAMLSRARAQQQTVVDRGQAAKTTSGDAYMDRVMVNLDIEFACDRLGVSSDDYVRLLRSVNTHTENDVERFQADRAMRGERYK